MISTIIWNMRGINTKGVMERIIIFWKMYHLAIIAFLDFFANSSNVMNFKNNLARDNAIDNCNGKISPLWNGDVDCVVKDHDDQQITCDFSHNELQK